MISKQLKPSLCKKIYRLSWKMLQVHHRDEKLETKIDFYAIAASRLILSALLLGPTRFPPNPVTA